jgi:glycosyltransferase involved in cell wall biosynthesis
MISIITPVFNGKRFIESCLQVVINQECADLEHIIVDGASTDGTVEVVQQYAARYPHIRWISEKDDGQSDAMNKGVAAARGEILGFLNVDDFYEPNVLNRQLEIFRTLPEPSFVVGNCNAWDDENKLLYVNKPSKLKLYELLKGFDVNPHPVNPSAYFYHTSLHRKIGLYRVDEDYALDLDFILRAVQAAKVYYFDEVWGNYRRLKGTKTAIDQQSGRSVERARLIFETYRKKLPLFQRCCLAIQERYYYDKRWARYFYYFERLGHYFKRPEEVPGMLKRKIGHI